MREKRRLEKVRDAVEVPDELREYFQWADRLIDEGDERTTVESDDLMQSDLDWLRAIVCGGLTSKEEGFWFQYWPSTDEDDDQRRPWELALQSDEIRDLAFGIRTTLELWRCQDETCTARWNTPDGTCFVHDYEDEPVRPKPKPFLP